MPGMPAVEISSVTKTFGSVTAVEANPASDLLVLESGGLIPLRFMTSHDPGSGTITVDIPEGLLDP